MLLEQETWVSTRLLTQPYFSQLEFYALVGDPRRGLPYPSEALHADVTILGPTANLAGSD